METDFDPIDLVQLTAGIASAAADVDWTIDQSAFLADVARMLHRLWLEIDQDEWSAVFAYEIAWPLGVSLGEHMRRMEVPLETLGDYAETRARVLIRRALSDT